jgi:hypothetical protein
MFINCSTCFERHIAHHQELKNCSCHGWVGTECPLSHDRCRQPQTYVKPEAAIRVFLSSYWWAVCRAKHVEQLSNNGIINNGNSASTQPWQLPATTNVCKTRGCNYSFELLMMSGVSLETCWAIKKHWNNKFYYTVASCWLFLYEAYSDCSILHNAHIREIQLR